MTQATIQMQSTRQRMLDYLQRHGKATVKELSQLLGLTSTGIRQHLTVLERDGLVQAHEERGRVGRPTFIYSLTEKADSLFPKNYDLLAHVLLEEVRDSEGKEHLHQLLHKVAERMAAPYIDQVKGKTLPERVKEAARIMEEQGCLVEVKREGEDFYIDEFNCPFPKVAEQDDAVCAFHVDFVRILTGGETSLTQSLLRGQCACTYRVRPA